MGAWHFWWDGTRRFWKNWGSYVALIFGTNLVISYLAIPFFNWALELLLKSKGSRTFRILTLGILSSATR